MDFIASPSSATTNNANGPGHSNSNIQTLLPAEQSEMENFRSNIQRNRQKTKHRKKQHALREALILGSTNTSSFIRFHCLQFPHLEIERGINIIKADREIKSKVGNVNIRKQNKNTFNTRFFLILKHKALYLQTS